MSIWPNTKIDPVEAVNDTPVGVTFAAAVVVTAPIPDATWNPVKLMTSFSWTITDPRAEVVTRVVGVTLALATCVVVPTPEVIARVVSV